MWEEREFEAKRLKAMSSKTLARWANCSLTAAWNRWYEQVVQARRALKACKLWLNRCLALDGVCPKCERKFKLWDDDWEQPMNDHAQMESDLLSRDEGGFVGLQVSEFAPHQVKQVDDLVDKHFVRHDSPGYSNPRIKIGDHILLVDGMGAEDVDLETLHRMLKGPLHTTVTLSLARAETGDEYSVVALRHGFRTFGEQQQASGAPVAAQPRPLADWPQDGLYGSQKSATYTASELYNSQRSPATASDLYASHRSAASGRISPPLAPLMNSDTGGAPRALSYVRQSRSPRAFTPPADEPNGVVGRARRPPCVLREAPCLACYTSGLFVSRSNTQIRFGLILGGPENARGSLSQTR